MKSCAKESIIPYLLLLSDNAESLGFIQDVFFHKGYQVATLLLGEQHLQQYLRSQQVHLVILDMKILKRDESFWLNQLKTLYPQLPVVVLSEKQEEGECVYALERGANDYLAKPFNSQELLARIRVILSYSYPDWVQKTFKSEDFLFDFGQAIFKKQGVLLNLTPRESELLQVFCQNQNQLLTREYLVKKISGKHYHPLDRHIDVHINHLRKKIEEDPKQPRYISTVWGRGYSFSLN